MYLNSVLELRVYSIYDPSLNGGSLEVGFARGDKIFGKAGLGRLGQTATSSLNAT